ncbi:MAG: hypothetical protein A2504_14365 [Bdellovibrionales bacterium RIFOXYD12_FULL_39_22]|nr:MAG: hypothetical protein A2385_04800 [Bdellovibrionales bacterium RIFOXYB1_FULL_39_21]OFZ43467.1 MAG: hypothetical protein A2485_13315 [Bdellovibrionales bacterium RIFOXYC12_FULL_39_17]OFZ47010.1 MAG: hypothetical protein A2404_00375 [Bdellovibrionales bacterium RIFOXYC1_FULL_39_130]OFZ73070.1 MAG: hypothetical protein A2451_08055 [Bdellovibrionales bacterium RIFOXYC2_FULL_39_8]OFZ76207.1 MAG: hypothetical protein A2560_07625 [Bdellovibrionales bacterium RIFOXYD1_FULL_39_84]OFZ94442.1 MAG:
MNDAQKKHKKQKEREEKVRQKREREELKKKNDPQGDKETGLTRIYIMIGVVIAAAGIVFYNIS